MSSIPAAPLSSSLPVTLAAADPALGAQPASGGLDFRAVLAAQLGISPDSAAMLPLPDPRADSLVEGDTGGDPVEAGVSLGEPGMLLPLQLADSFPLAVPVPAATVPAATLVEPHAMPEANDTPLDRYTVDRQGHHAVAAGRLAGQAQAELPAAALPHAPAVLAASTDGELQRGAANAGLAPGPNLPQVEGSVQRLQPDTPTAVATSAPLALREGAARGPEPLHPASAVSVHNARFADEVGNRIVWMAGHGQQFAELRLNPPQLGPLEVRLSLSGEQATLTLLSAQPAVRDALQAGLPRLQEMMQGAGIDLGNVFVGAQGSGQQPGDRSSGAEHLPRMGDSDTGMAPAASVAVRVGLGAVDVYA